jgi:SAM-dependent methyltransferase
MTTRFDKDDTRRSYDRIAGQYAAEIAGELANKPFDRAFLDQFAESVGGKGPVVELGCGPAHVAAYLAGRGVEMSGLDLSPAMVTEAHRLFPELVVIEGDMLALPFADSSLAGVIAFYSIIHFDDSQLRRAFGEMARVLQPGGLVGLAFHIGDEVIHREEWWGEPVSVDFRFLQPDHVAMLLDNAGLSVISTQERVPYPPGIEFQSRRAYLVAERRR